MGFFRKKEVGTRGGISELSELPELPELPQMPDLPELPETKSKVREIGSLPSFLGSQFERSEQESDIILEPPKEKRTLEISSPAKIKLPQPSLMPPIAQFQQLPTQKKQLLKEEPIYVRIDKFRNAYNNFQEIYSKISEIEELFKEIKETKQREEEELTKWEKEIEALKMRIDAINQNIFSKIK